MSFLVRYCETTHSFMLQSGNSTWFTLGFLKSAADYWTDSLFDYRGSPDSEKA